MDAKQGVRGLLLNPQGHILAELLTFARADDLLVITHAAVRERTAAHLEKYIIMDDVQLADLTDKFSSLALEGPAARPIIQEVFGASPDVVPLLTQIEIRIGDFSCLAIRFSHFGEDGVEFLVPRESFAAVWQSYYLRIHDKGGGPLGYEAINAMRLEAGIPWFGYDFGDNVIPHEAGLESSHISYTKGCYTGQEIVERVRSRGHVQRKLTRLQFLGLQVPSAGSKLLAENAEAGTVTSAAFAPRLGRVLGFGYVRTEHREAGTMLSWSGGEVEVL
jgi:folate-binding protein YgfZ